MSRYHLIPLLALVAACDGGTPPGGKEDPSDPAPDTADTTPPTLESVRAIAHDTIVAELSEPLAAATAADASRYTVQAAEGSSPAVVAASVAAGAASVTLGLDASMQHGLTYTLLVAGVADVAGNVLVSQRRDFAGRGPVVAELEGAPSDVTRETAASIAVGGIDIVSYQYRLGADGTWSSERGAGEPILLSGLADGAYLLEVVGCDSLGNWQPFAAPTRAVFEVDTSAPVAVLSGAPAALVRSDSVTVSVGGDGVTAYRHGLDGGVFGDETPVAVPITSSGLADGTHGLRVIARDRAGNWQSEASPTEHTWEIDSTAPVATLDGLPEDPTNVTSASIAVGGEGVTLYRFRVDGGAWSAETAVTSAIALGELAEGGHRVDVVGGDDAGNWQPESTATSHGWEIDLTAPAATLSSVPADPSNRTDVVIAVGGDGVTRFRFRLDGGVWSGRIEASLGLALSGLTEGSHLVEVVGIDAAGNEDLSLPTSYGWHVDLTAPTASLGNLPASPTAATGASIDVGPADVVAYQYRLDGGPASGEVASDVALALNGLDEGGHTLEVIGRDQAGNWQAMASATRLEWQIDLTPPAAMLSGLPAPLTSVQDLEVTVAGEGVVAYRYQLDGMGFGADTDVAVPIQASGLGEGPHTLEVIGVDAVGNWQLEAAASTHDWLVDLSAPTAVLDGTPPDPDNHADVTITVAGSGTVAYSHRLDGGGWSAETPATTPLVLSGLSEGRHTLEVVAKDDAGNWQLEADASTHGWTVDLSAPVVVLDNVPPDPTRDTGAAFGVGPAEVVAYRVSVDGGVHGPETPSATGISLSGLAEGDHHVAVVGRDRAGNWQLEAGATTHAWTVDLTPPAVPAVSDGGATSTALALGFGWSNPGDADDVLLQVATDSAFAAVVWGGASGSSIGLVESYTYVADPADGATYYARIKVVDAAGNTSAFGAASDGITLVGDLTGKVRDSNGNDLSGATVELRLAADDSLVGTATTGAAGDFAFTSVAIGANVYALEVTLAGYGSATKNNVTVSVGTSNDVGIIYLVADAATAGSIGGSVVDANDGAVLAGATVSVRDWTGAEVATVTSDAAGAFATASLTPGTYTLVLTLLGYFALTVDNVVVDGDVQVGAQALCEVLAEPHLRVVLLWGASPADLDLHVVGPSAQTVDADGKPTDRFHVYWEDQKSFDENDGSYGRDADPDGSFATTSLVQDDTNRYGPEAVNLFGNGSGYAHGTYTFTVHRWSWAGTWYDAPITLRIFDSQGLVREIPIPTGGGNARYWRAFKIDIQGQSRAQRTITVENTFGSLTYDDKASMDW